MNTIIIIFIATFATFAQKSKANVPTSKNGTPIFASYSCPLHPEVVSNHPGTCAKCSSKLVVNRTSSKHGETVYSCSMHPNETSATPGKCPICGMDMTAKNKKQ